ncbi:MAG: hypothetical protein GY929_16625, partial [Actinomycetia bacterium]|nr:hypothetical protein [Actinomycetes bacterium]
MAPIVEHRRAGLDPVALWLNAAVASWFTVVIGWMTIAVSLAARRVRHVVLLIGSLSLTAAVATPVAALIERPRPLGLSQLGEWEGFAQPSRPMALATATVVAAGLT